MYNINLSSGSAFWSFKCLWLNFHDTNLRRHVTKMTWVNKVIELERHSYFYNTLVLCRAVLFQEFYWMLSKVYLNERKYKCIGWRLYYTDWVWCKNVKNRNLKAFYACCSVAKSSLSRITLTLLHGIVGSKSKFSIFGKNSLGNKTPLIIIIE